MVGPVINTCPAFWRLICTFWQAAETTYISSTFPHWSGLTLLIWYLALPLPLEAVTVLHQQTASCMYLGEERAAVFVMVSSYHDCSLTSHAVNVKHVSILFALVNPA